MPWVVLAIARPFGFTMLFAAFAWGNISSGVIRMAFSIAIALPLLANGIPSYGVEELQLAFAATLIKELFLGAVLGLISSIPLAIAIAGGSILDLYRGALEGGPDPIRRNHISLWQSVCDRILVAVCLNRWFPNCNGYDLFKLRTLAGKQHVPGFQCRCHCAS